MPLTHSLSGLLAVLALSAPTLAQAAAAPPGRVVLDMPTDEGLLWAQAALDMDADGRADLVTTLREDTSFPQTFQLRIAPFLPDGRVGEPSLELGGLTTTRILAGRFDTDGTRDLLLWWPYADHVSVVRLPAADAPAVSIGATGAEPGSVAVGDLDGDGLDDAVITRPNPDRVTSHLSDGQGGLVDTASRKVGADPQGLALADVDNDGDLDALAATQAGVDLTAGNGLGALGIAITVIPTASEVVVAGDWDADGVVDLCAGLVGGAFAVHPGAGDGSFGLGQALPGTSGLALAKDLDGDHVDDLVLQDASTGLYTTWLGNAAGLQLAPPTGAIQVNSNPSYNSDHTPAFADIDGNGTLDMLNVVAARQIVASDGRGDGSFVAADTLPGVTAPGDPEESWITDLDGDGDLDVLSVTVLLGPTTYLNDGSGQMTLADSEPAHPASIFTEARVADVHGDGLLDVLVTTDGTNPEELVLIPGGVGGQLAPPVTILASQEICEFVTGDFDLDGDVDLALVVFDSPNPNYELRLALGNGDGSFAPPGPVIDGNPSSNHFRNMAVGDVNGDGKPDVIADTDSFTTAYLGQGDGTFVPQPKGGATGASSSLYVVDVNGDGFDDLIRGAAVVGIRVWAGAPHGIGALQWTTHAKIATEFVFGDVDADGQVDMLAQIGSIVSLRRGQPGHAFGPAELHAGPIVTGVADMDGDGWPDLVRNGMTSISLGSAAAPWTGLAQGLPGVDVGGPCLRATGTLTALDPFTLTVCGGPATASAFLVLGLAEGAQPFKGGVLVPDPAPPSLLVPLTLDAAGGVALELTWPAGLPAGVSTWWQTWIQDASAAEGWSATNAIRGTTP